MTMMSRQQEAMMKVFAEEAAARHRIPKSTVTHPTGVLVSDGKGGVDEFMTEKIADPDYVPYCGPCVTMRRLRRTEFGFQCPGCGRKLNYDLTVFNDNKDVKYKTGVM